MLDIAQDALTILSLIQDKEVQFLGAEAVPIDRLTYRFQQVLYTTALLHLLIVGVDAIVFQAQPNDPGGRHRFQYLRYQEALLPFPGLDDHHVGSSRLHPNENVGIDCVDPDDRDT